MPRRTTSAAVAAALLAAAAPLAARADRHPLLPDRAKLQLAGNLGLVSGGPGWAFARERLELDLLAGWVPERWGGDDLVSLTAKLTWLTPSRAAAGWRVRPLTLALAATYTRGEGFWLRQPSRYPGGYYLVPTALRATIALGATVIRVRGPLAGTGLYAEVVALDAAVVHWIRNPRTTRASDVLSLALGVRAEF